MNATVYSKMMDFILTMVDFLAHQKPTLTSKTKRAGRRLT